MRELISFPRLQQVLADYADDIVYRYKESLSENDRRATGELITSVHSTVTVNQTEYAIDLSLKDYYIFIENGTRPHMPPVNKILEWVKVKPVLPRPNGGKLPTEEQLAWMIAKKIEREGTEGSHDLERALTETEVWEQRIVDALDEDVLDAIDRLF